MGLGSNPNPLRGKEEQLHYYGNWKEKILNTKHYLSWEASDHLHCNWTRVANSFLLSSLWPFVGKLNLSGQTYCRVTYHCIPTSSPPVDLGFVKSSLTHRSTGHRFESYHVADIFFNYFWLTARSGSKFAPQWWSPVNRIWDSEMSMLWTRTQSEPKKANLRLNYALFTDVTQETARI